MSKIGSRLFRFRKAFNLTQTELANLVGASTSTISEVEAEKRPPSYEIVSGIVLHYPTLNAEWLLTGRGIMLNDVTTVAVLSDQEPDGLHGKGEVVRIPFFPDVSAAAGAGAVPGDETEMSYFFMGEEILRDLYGAQSRRLVVFPIRGDSMDPILRSGELVLVELAQSGMFPLDDGIYVFSLDGAVMVKYLQKVPGGIEVVSTNKAFRTIKINFSDESINFSLIGRAIVGMKRL